MLELQDLFLRPLSRTRHSLFVSFTIPQKLRETKSDDCQGKKRGLPLKLDKAMPVPYNSAHGKTVEDRV